MRKETNYFSRTAPEKKHPATRSWVRKNIIGKGSFGTVSLGVDGGRVFAVKSVDKNSSSQAQLDALEIEISILRSLSSPYVVKYCGDDVTVEEAESSSYPAVFRNIHLEYLSGGTAVDVGNDLETVRQYTWCVASALKYVHSMGIVHCDVKGRNVLVGSAPGLAILADFGSAKRVSVPAVESGKILPRGSPLWMAPEVVRGESQGFESDVWSLGCTVIEMITGKPAWKDEGADTLRRIGYSSDLPDFPNQLSELGRDFLEKCLRREPSQRWSCGQLLQHPFLCSAPAIQIADDSTPRSVLDRSNLDLSEDEEEGAEEEEEEEEELENPFSDSGHLVISSAAERIVKLATTSGANWESDGWVEVRSLEHEEHGGGASKVGTVAAASEYVDLIPRCELEMGGAISESECCITWMDPGVLNGCRGGAYGCREGGSSWHDSEDEEEEETAAELELVRKAEVADDGVEFSPSSLLFSKLLLILLLLLCFSATLRKYDDKREMQYFGYLFFLDNPNLILFSRVVLRCEDGQTRGYHIIANGGDWTDNQINENIVLTVEITR
ncbi:hypothetical protein Dimus_009287 [Dionaea muscipula]